jgi:chloramphenicol 3-O-phosphotransferase
MPSLMIVTGPPGAGKSTVAALVARGADEPTVHMHTDTFYVWIRSGFVLPYLPEARRQNEVVSTVMVAAASGYASGGYDVVLDGILGPWALQPFRDASVRDGVALSYVVLRPSLEVALARATAREGRALREVGPIEGLYDAFADLGELEHCVIDSTGQTPEETAAAMRHRDRFVISGE